MSEPAVLDQPTVVTKPETPAPAEPEVEYASMDDLEEKETRTRDFTFDLNGKTRKMKLKAIGGKEYDVLLTTSPPTTPQKAQGASYDQGTFAPKLLARCVVIPAMAEAKWRNLWKSEEWNRQELADLFFAAVDICSRGLNVDPTETD